MKNENAQYPVTHLKQCTKGSRFMHNCVPLNTNINPQNLSCITVPRISNKWSQFNNDAKLTASHLTTYNPKCAFNIAAQKYSS